MCLPKHKVLAAVAMEHKVSFLPGAGGQGGGPLFMLLKRVVSLVTMGHGSGYQGVKSLFQGLFPRGGGNLKQSEYVYIYILGLVKDMVVVGKHYTSLLIVVYWLKSPLNC